MKLPIKKKWFDKIKLGEKQIEWRDAHITFICEETGEKLRKEIKSCSLLRKGKYEDWDDNMGMSRKEFGELFEDEYVVYFELEGKR